MSSVCFSVALCGDTSMASMLKKAVPALLTTLLLHWFSDGMHPLWPLAWIAALPVLWFAAQAPAWLSAGVAFLAWFAGSFTLWGYFVGTIHMPIPVACGIFAFSALAPTLAAVLFGALLRRGAAGRRTKRRPVSAPRPKRRRSRTPPEWACESCRRSTPTK